MTLQSTSDIAPPSFGSFNSPWTQISYHTALQFTATLDIPPKTATKKWPCIRIWLYIRSEACIHFGLRKKSGPVSGFDSTSYQKLVFILACEKKVTLYQGLTLHPIRSLYSFWLTKKKSGSVSGFDSTSNQKLVFILAYEKKSDPVSGCDSTSDQKLVFILAYEKKNQAH